MNLRARNPRAGDLNENSEERNERRGYKRARLALGIRPAASQKFLEGLMLSVVCVCSVCVCVCVCLFVNTW